MGTQGANSGVSAGFYQNPSYLTSQQVWANRPGFIYTGQYASSSAYQPGQAGYQGYVSPTTITGGNRLGDATVTTGQQVGNSYIVDVKLMLTAAEAAVFANGADIFWGTGDCSNGSFLATVGSLMGSAGNDVPEPATLALLMAGLLSLTILRRRGNARID